MGQEFREGALGNLGVLCGAGGPIWGFWGSRGLPGKQRHREAPPPSPPPPGLGGAPGRDGPGGSPPAAGRPRGCWGRCGVLLAAVGGSRGDGVGVPSPELPSPWCWPFSA